MSTAHPTLRSGRLVVAAGMAALAMIGASCSSDDSASTAAPTTVSSGGITFSGQWARTSPMSAENGAAYVRVSCPTDDALVGVAVEAGVADEVELHETVMGGMTSDTTMGMGSDTTMAGQMTMQPVDRIECTAAAGAELQPGGYHIMLFGLSNPLKVGDTLPITLTFEQAGDVVVDFPVLEDAP